MTHFLNDILIRICIRSVGPILCQIEDTLVCKTNYSYLPNKRAGPNKRAEWKIGQKQIIVQA